MPVRLNRFVGLALYGLAAVMAWNLYQRLYADRGQLAVSVDAASPDTLVMAWHHEIKLPMAKLMADAFAARKDSIRRIVIDLDSPGGSLDEGAAVVAVIATMRQSLEVDTRVGAGHDCLSMCVPIFLQGKRRLAAANSRWLFHEPRSVDYFSGKDVSTPGFENRYFARRYLDTYFASSPVDPAWLARTAPLWQGRDLWRSGRQLVDEHSNIITGLE
jgi:hypothetical protein